MKTSDHSRRSVRLLIPKAKIIARASQMIKFINKQKVFKKVFG